MDRGSECGSLRAGACDSYDWSKLRVLVFLTGEYWRRCEFAEKRVVVVVCLKDHHYVNCC